MTDPTNLAADVARFRRQAHAEALTADSLMDMIELRVATLEQIAAARWPRRILVRARLGRQLRASIRHIPGATFADRRTEAVTADWIAR